MFILLFASLPVIGDENQYESGPPLTSIRAENEIVLSKTVSSYKRNRKSGETVITDSFNNQSPTARLFFSATQAEGVVGVSATVSFQNNTYLPVAEDDMGLSLWPENEQRATVTAKYWGEKGGDSRAAVGRNLFGRLISGATPGKALVECRCEVKSGQGKKYSYVYSVRNASDKKLSFRWGGFEGTLAPGKSFSTVAEADTLTREVVGTAEIEFSDKTKFRFRANQWAKP